MSETKTLGEFMGIDPKFYDFMHEIMIETERRPFLGISELYDIAAEIMTECEADSIRRVKSALDYAENDDRRRAEGCINIVIGITVALAAVWRVCGKHDFMDFEMRATLSRNINAIFQMAENAAITGEWSEPEFPEIPRIKHEKKEAEE